MNFSRLLLTILSLVLLPFSSHALKFDLPKNGENLVGNLQIITTQPRDTLSRLGMKYDIGYYSMLEANPDLPERAALTPGTKVVIPTLFILPHTHEGIIVNLAELRAYYFPANEKVVYIFPIGAGREGWNTPRAITEVINKKENPIWIKPDSILAEDKALGKPYKKYYPGGTKDNPLGKYAIYFALPGIRMHGTNYPATVGQRASHGCMRMLPQDIEFLYEHVPIGTRVIINHNENKVGWRDHILYLSAEIPFPEYADGNSLHEALTYATKNHGAIINKKRLEAVQNDQMGIPIAIGHDASLRELPQDTAFQLTDDSEDASDSTNFDVASSGEEDSTTNS